MQANLLITFSYDGKLLQKRLTTHDINTGKLSGLGFQRGSMVWFDGKGLDSVRNLV